MYALKINFISKSWNSEDCAAATSGRTILGSRGRPLEIIDWIHISISSLLLPMQAAMLGLSVLGAGNKKPAGAQMLPPLRIVV